MVVCVCFLLLGIVVASFGWSWCASRLVGAVAAFFVWGVGLVQVGLAGLVVFLCAAAWWASAGVSLFCSLLCG